MTRALNILVVDDELSFARMLGRALRKLGHAPTIASHPRDALQIFRSRSFDAVITDIDMPEMSGIELAAWLRAEESDLPIAFCTGSAAGSDRVEAAARFGLVGPKLWRSEDVAVLLASLPLRS